MTNEYPRPLSEILTIAYLRQQQDLLSSGLVEWGRAVVINITVLNAIREFIPNSINTIGEECWKKVSNSTNDNNHLNGNKNWYNYLLFIIFIEVSVDYCPDCFPKWIGGEIIFTDSLQVSLRLCGQNFVKNLEFKNNLRARLKKWPFSNTFEVPDKFLNASRNSDNFRTGSHSKVWNQIF